MAVCGGAPVNGKHVAALVLLVIFGYVFAFSVVYSYAGSAFFFGG